MQHGFVREFSDPRFLLSFMATVAVQSQTIFEVPREQQASSCNDLAADIAWTLNVPDAIRLWGSLLFLIVVLPAFAFGQEAPQQAPLPKPDIVLPRNASPEDLERARAKIAEFLLKHRKQQTVAPTGDPAVDEVIDVIRKQGSVLDGSLLDPNSGDPLSDQPSIAVVSPSDQVRGVTGLAPEANDQDSRYLAAEQLLRAARGLHRVSGNDPGQRELVFAMRRQAARLLLETMAEDSSSYPQPFEGNAP